MDDEVQREIQNPTFHEQSVGANPVNPTVENDDHHAEEDKWWENESQYLLDSQQLVEGLSLCDELLQSQSPSRDGNDTESKERVLKDGKPRLSDYVHLGPESLKKDLEECQNPVFDTADLELDTPPEFRLSQLVSLFQFSIVFSLLFLLSASLCNRSGK